MITNNTKPTSRINNDDLAIIVQLNWLDIYLHPKSKIQIFRLDDLNWLKLE